MCTVSKLDPVLIFLYLVAPYPHKTIQKVRVNAGSIQNLTETRGNSMHYTRFSDGFMHGFQVSPWFALWTSFCGFVLPWGFVIPALWMSFCGGHPFPAPPTPSCGTAGHFHPARATIRPYSPLQGAVNAFGRAGKGTPIPV